MSLPLGDVLDPVLANRASMPPARIVLAALTAASAHGYSPSQVRLYLIAHSPSARRLVQDSSAFTHLVGAHRARYSRRGLGGKVGGGAWLFRGTHVCVANVLASAAPFPGARPAARAGQPTPKSLVAARQATAIVARDLAREATVGGGKDSVLVNPFALAVEMGVSPSSARRALDSAVEMGWLDKRPHRRNALAPYKLPTKVPNEDPPIAMLYADLIDALVRQAQTDQVACLLAEREAANDPEKADSLAKAADEVAAEARAIPETTERAARALVVWEAAWHPGVTYSPVLDSMAWFVALADTLSIDAEAVYWLPVKTVKKARKAWASVVPVDADAQQIKAALDEHDLGNECWLRKGDADRARRSRTAKRLESLEESRALRAKTRKWLEATLREVPIPTVRSVAGPKPKGMSPEREAAWTAAANERMAQARTAWIVTISDRVLMSRTKDGQPLPVEVRTDLARALATKMRSHQLRPDERCRPVARKMCGLDQLKSDEKVA